MVASTDEGARNILHAEKRIPTHKRAVQRLRAAGKIPAIVYGHTKPVAISIDEHSFMHRYYPVPENVIIALHIDSKSRDVLVKDYDFDPRNGQILHIDFLEFERGKEFKTHVPITITGSSSGVRKGGIFEQPLHQLEIVCLPRNLPKEIAVDISHLEINHSIHVGDISLPEGVRTLNSEDQVVSHVAMPKIELPTDKAEAEAKAEEEEGEEHLNEE